MIRKTSHVQTGRSHGAGRPQRQLDGHPEHGTKHTTEEGSEDEFTQITDNETEYGTDIDTEYKANGETEEVSEDSTKRITLTETEDGAVDQPELQPQGEQALPAPDFETEALLSHALELDPINREEVFDYIVVKTKELRGKRHGWFFETEVGKTVGNH